MKILIVSATWMEVKLITDELIYKEEKSHNLKQFQWNNSSIDFLITGIGTTLTTFHLTQTLNEFEYDWVINLGIAGSYTTDLKIGEVVEVATDEFADLGIEKRNEFLTLFDAGFVEANEFPFQQGLLKSTGGHFFDNLKKVKGITSNKSSGRQSSIAELSEKFHPQVESMEGAAFFYVCNWLGINCVQIRAVSNFVEPRESSKWNIPLALENLKITFLQSLQKQSIPIS